LLGSLNEGGFNGIDLSGLLGNLNNDSSLDLGGIIEGISSASNSVDFDGLTEDAGQLTGDAPTALLSVADLFQGNSSLGNIDLGNIAPDITDSTQQILGNSTLPSYDAASLPPATPSLELEQPIVFG